jgi:DNA-binding beta-propeller fold protein YncE
MTSSRILPALLGLLAGLALLAVPASAIAAKPSSTKHPVAPKSTKRGSLVQLGGTQGCLVDGGRKGAFRCGKARALMGPGPFMGSRAIAVSPDGHNVYVAAAKSDAIAVFVRDRTTGALKQPQGKGGCVAVKGAEGCALAVGLIGPNSIAISPDGRYVYATSREGASLTSFHRNRKTGALKQLLPSSSGCISGLPIPGCTPGRALSGPDVVVVSPDGNNVYVGAFFGNAVAAFARNPTSGALTQLGGTAGCIAAATSGCTTGIALGSIEGLAVSPGGTTVYAAAALSNAVDVLYRDPTTGALSQATNGSGCITDAALTGCTTGLQLAGANAVAVAPRGGDVYATSLFSNSVTSFTPTEGTIGLTQKPGASGCLIYLRAAACSFGLAMVAPEGLAVSPEGASVYVASYKTGAIDVLDRNPETGTVTQKPGARGCLAPKTVLGCSPGRALGGVSSVAVSPDGRNVYSTASASNAVDVFRRIK